MANIDPAPSWADIRQLETTDPNLAGPGGILNVPTIGIAARLNLLRDNAAALNNTVSGVSSRQDSADSAIASLQSQVLDAPGTLSDLDNGNGLDPDAAFPDILSVENSLGPVAAINSPIQALVARTKQLKSDIEDFQESLGSAAGSTEIGYAQDLPDAVFRNLDVKVSEWVSAEDFGAVGDGVTDDSAAIQKALSVPGRCVLFLPMRTYVCSSIKPANGTHMLGFSGNGYTGDESQNRPRLLMRVGAACLLDMTGTRSVSASGLLFDGRDKSVPLISSGASRFTASYCRFINGSVGLGGTISGGGSAYTRTAHLLRCTFASNGVGVQNLIDSFSTQCEFADNGQNIYAVPGADSNSFVNCRFEWASSGNNLRIVGAAGSRVASYIFAGCLFDRGFGASIFLNYAYDFTFAGCIVRRANRGNATTLTGDCNVYMSNCDSISFTGATQSSGRDDGAPAEAPVTPGYAYAFDMGNTNISITGGSIASSFPKGLLRNADAVTGLKVLGVTGLDERITGGVTGPQINNGQVYRSAATGGDIAPSGTATRSVVLRRTINTNSITAVTLNVFARNVSTGAGNSAAFLVQLVRLGGAPSISAGLLGEAGAGGYIGLGVGTISLAFSNVATDGSSFEVVVTNNSTAAASVTCILV